MRNFFTIILVIFTSINLWGSDTLYTLVIKEDLNEVIKFPKALDIYVDSQQSYSAELFLQDSIPPYIEPTKEQMSQKPLTVWCAFNIINQTSTIQSGFLPFWTMIDSIEIFVYENGRLVDKKISGRRIRPQNKVLYHYNNHLPFSIDAGSKKTYIIRLLYDNKIRFSNRFFTFSRIFSTKESVHARIFAYSTQFFYFGIMLVFALISIFMFFLFREKIFIYFGGIMLSLIAYFMSYSGILGMLFNRVAHIDDYFCYMVTPVLCGLLFFLFMFISSYTKLRHQLPKYYQFYLFFSTIAIVIPLLLQIFSNDRILLITVHNTLMLLFIVFSLIPIVILSLRGDKSAITILLSILSLAASGASLLIILLYQGGAYGNMPTLIFQFGTVVFSSILFHGLFQKFNSIREEKLRFQELDFIKSRFFTNISHEFRTPLTLVLGPVKNAAESHPDPRAKKQLLIAHHNAQRLLELINQLLDLSKLEAGKMQLKAQEQNLYTLLKGIVMSYESLADTQHIRLNFGSKNENLMLYIDTEKIEKIFFNLLSNAFKFSEENDEISVIITEETKVVEVLIRDTGIGIDEDRLPYIFDRFFQANDLHYNQHEGSGIGLSLVKELVELHKGTITVTSEKGKGTSFTIRLLKGKNHLSEQDIIIPNKDLPALTTRNIFRDAIQINNSSDTRIKHFFADEPIVLIVDDNADIRAYIKGYLEEDFRIIEAQNGQEGIEKAIQHLPDLIISDVMMPQKNGYEVCETLKNDLRTSHIPIILLTAKAAQAEKIQGLKIGADDYLIKPFDHKELLIRVHNLIKIRQQLRHQFSQLTDQPKIIGTNDLDRAFYEQVVNTIQEKLSDSQFSVEVLAMEMGMSRTQLNRKLKALTDQTAAKLMQDTRLQTAHQLIIERRGNVSEIAFETGFSSTAYFVKCYREQYGETPGSILKR